LYKKFVIDCNWM